MILPDHPDKFDAAWLASILGAPAPALCGWHSTPIGTGQVGDSYRLMLEWNEADAAYPHTIIAKCPAAHTKSRETGRDLHNYEMEIMWYTHFASQAKLRTPYCYHAEIAADMMHFILLMEDVAPAQQIDQLGGGTIEQIKSVLDEAALLHGFRWNDQGLRDIAWLNFSQGNAELVRNLLPVIYPEWCARYAGRLSEDVFAVGHGLITHYDNYIKERDRPLCVTHGDLRLDNILYPDQAGRAILVDWQTVSAGTAMADIAYFIGTSFADFDSRAAHEADLVTHYLARLAAQNIIYDADRAWQDYRLAAFGGFLMAVIAAMLVERTPRGDEMFAVMAERSAMQALALDSLSLL